MARSSAIFRQDVQCNGFDPPAARDPAVKINCWYLHPKSENSQTMAVRVTVYEGEEAAIGEIIINK